MEMLARQTGANPSAYQDVETGAVQVSVYSAIPPENSTSLKSDLRRNLHGLQQLGLDTGTSGVSVVKLPQENWAETWKRHFPPLEIGDKLLIKPGWNKRKPKANQKVVVLNPGLSFGTGQHPTTHFCLQEIARSATVREPKSFLDMGTGSGILAIAAAKLGCAPVDAFDHDEQCIKVARENSKRNRTDKRITLRQADLTKLPIRPASQYDLVCANILANLLISERKRIYSRVTKSGVLVVAGILNREFAEVQSAYEADGWKLLRSKVEKEWRSGSFARAKT